MTITLNSPEAAAAAAPFLLGFTPEDSLVLILIDGEGQNVTMRVDLPWSPDVEWLKSILTGLPEPMPARLVMLAYAHEADSVLAVGIAHWLSDVLSPLMEVADILLVCGGRVLSVNCTCDDCTAGQGTAVDDLEDHPVIAQCVAAGLTRLNRRDDLEDQLLPVDDSVSEAVARMLGETLRVVGDYETKRDEMEAQALAILMSGEDLDAESVVLLARACADVHVRDPLLALILGGEDGTESMLGSIRTRLTYVLIHLPVDFAGPVAATLALLAWADGDGASALVAADAALDFDPENSLAPLVCHALSQGLPPTTWAKISREIPIDVLRGREKRSA